MGRHRARAPGALLAVLLLGCAGELRHGSPLDGGGDGGLARGDAARALPDGGPDARTALPDAGADAGAPAPDGWSLVWQDEFDGEGLPDPARWSYDVGGGGWGNGESQHYTDARTENARVEGGLLIIEARREDYGGNAYTSARIVSATRGDWLYGRFEIRARLPAGRGTWPAIWMLPTDWEYGGWPASGEIDIMEHVGHDEGRVHGTVHTRAYNHTIGTAKGSSVLVPDVTSGFHVYSAEWGPEQIAIAVDGETYFTFDNEHTGFETWPFDRRFHVVLNVAIGGWGGAMGIDDTIFPVRMEIDWVRAYQRD